MAPTDTNRPQRTRSGYLAIFAVALVLVGIHVLPVDWTGNEVNYFDLSHKYVTPEAFDTNSALFDNTHARFLSYTIIGHTIAALGFDGAQVVLGLILWVLTSAALAFLAQSLRLSLAEATAAIGIFAVSPEALLAQEWVLGGVEGKTFAYVFAFLGLGFAFRGKFLSAVILMAVATYLHFLVGGFWALAIVLIHWFTSPRVRTTLYYLGVYIVLVSPLAGIIVYERLGVEVDMTDIDVTIEYIYAVFRNHHHVAPLTNFYYFRDAWIGGLIMHVGMTLLFALLARRDWKRFGIPAATLACLNGYIVLMMVVAVLDRNTHYLAHFYLFRPAGLTLLLSILVGARFLGDKVKPDATRSVTVMALGLAAFWGGPKFLLALENATVGYQPLEERALGGEREMIDWIRANTEPGEVVLVEPRFDMVFQGENEPPAVAYERLFGRPTLVSFKFVPTNSTDIARWYRLITWRADLFAGDCSLAGKYPADYMVFRGGDPAPLAACAEPVFQSEGYTVARLTN